ncbi:hypothetical protein FRC15_000749 [Serendipita sp. 397]|nr:hypothetical protein FRC15_000749 [Serendipita sp. 397]
MQPVSPPRSARRTDLYNPPTNTNTNSINQSPRSTSAQAIVRPYVVGAHPYASPSSGRATSSQGRPSIEHTGNYTVAIAPGTYAGDQPYSANSVNGIAGAGAGMGSEGGLGLSGHTTFAGAGSRPGYEAYGIESRQPVVQGLHTRPSLESIRTIARKASIDRTAVATATDFALGGPTAVGSRQRNDSITSSVYRGNVSSTYAGGGGGSGGGGGGGSIKSGKSGSATKEKYTKQDRAREMAAMENLIAALDESAAKEKQRKRTLAEAAGVADPAPSNNNNNNVVGSRRKDTAVTGSYPLPPAEVFRAALSMADPDDDLDDEEIERWKRR